MTSRPDGNDRTDGPERGLPDVLEASLPDGLEDGVEIRRATRADVPAIVALLADDPLGSQRERHRDPLPQAYLDAFDEIDADPHQWLMVVTHDERVIGTMQLTIIPYLTYQGGKRGQIEAVRIDRRHRGQKLGQMMFAWAIDRARELGCHVVQLTADKQRTDAHRFYHRLGFVASHEGMKLHLTQGDERSANSMPGATSMKSSS